MDFIAVPCRARRITATRFISAIASCQRNYFGARIEPLRDYKRRIVRQPEYGCRCSVGIDRASCEYGGAVERSVARRGCRRIHQVVESHPAPAEEALVITRCCNGAVTHAKRRGQSVVI